MLDSDYSPRFAFSICRWYRWFAWRPVRTLDRGWRWLRVVHRRRVQTHAFLDGPVLTWDQYAVGR